jgi:hypothetical protein
MWVKQATRVQRVKWVKLLKGVKWSGRVQRIGGLSV